MNIKINRDPIASIPLKETTEGWWIPADGDPSLIWHRINKNQCIMYHHKDIVLTDGNGSRLVVPFKGKITITIEV